ncbi:MAG TPA: VCBS repeat-containing protein, partial [Acidimicrobiia bacterium]|nr:VCBS repeat-containing protein [Acidimicrobiia bacterium]
MNRRIAVILMLALVSACTTTATEDGTGATSDPPDGVATTNGEDGGSVTSAQPGDPGMGCWATEAHGGPDGLRFEDVTEPVGLLDPLTGMHGHTAIWTDTNGDDWPDLYVGTFADREVEAYQERGAEGPSPDRLLVGGDATFALDETIPETFSRSSGGVGADLDNDGDLDLVVSRNTDEPQPGQSPTQILENVDGVLQVVESSGIAEDLGGRSVGVLDFDQDGFVDLFIAEDRFAGETSVLFRNEGGLSFSDANSEAGIPDGVHGLGVAVADFDRDGLSDIFVSGSNRLFMSAGPGSFEEADSSVFEWELYGDEDDVAGASVADVNRDGLLDLAL